MVCSNRAGVASIYSRARGPSGRKVSSSGATLQAANGMGKGRGRCCVSWRCSTKWSRGMGRCGLVWNGRCSARQRRRLRRRAVAVWHGAANGDVWRSPGSVVIVCARGEGGARSVGFSRAWRSFACSARLTEERARRSWVLWSMSSRQGWSRGGGEPWVISQTRLARLVLPLACCRLWGGIEVLGCSPLMAMASSQGC